jgi:hypothetical protein
MHDHRLAITDPRVVLSQMTFVIVGINLVAGMSSIPSVGWMFMHHPDDFRDYTWTAIFDFLWGLRTGIPPFLAGLELVLVKLTGSAHWVTVYGYQVALISVYLLAMQLARATSWRYGLSVLASGVFFYTTVLVHPAVPASYDLFFPAFFLLFVTLLQWAIARAEGCWAMAAAVLSGFFLAMTELSRPFVIYWLPMLLFITGRMVGRNRGVWLGFMAPIVLISGLWHVHLYLDFRQLTFTNHTGANLARGWPQVEHAAPIDETSGVAVRPGRWFDRNTEVHTQNSRMLERAVFRYWLDNPWASVRHLAYRLSELLSAKTRLYSHDPQSWVLWIYRPMVWLTVGILLGAVLFWGREAFGRGNGIDWPASGGDIIVTGFTLYCLLVLAIGEAGEEARLLISVLPMLAVCPLPNGRLLMAFKKTCSP